MRSVPAATTRLVAGLSAWILAASIVAVGLALARRPWAWLWLAVLLGLVPSQLAWSLAPAARIRPAVAALAGAVVGTVAAGLVVGLTPVPPARLEEVIERMVVPATWEQVGVERDGDPYCVTGCPAVARRFRTVEPAATTVRTAAAMLRSQGFPVRATDRDSGVDLRGGSGQIDAAVRIEEGERGATAVTLRLTGRPPLG